MYTFPALRIVTSIIERRHKRVRLKIKERKPRKRGSIFYIRLGKRIELQRVLVCGCNIIK